LRLIVACGRVITDEPRVRDVQTPGVRESLFPGGRVKEFIAAAHGQLDAHPPPP